MSRNFHLIHSIRNEYWFLNLDHNLDYLNVVLQGVMNPNLTSQVDAEDYAPVTSSRVAVIPIVGVLTKYDGICGTPGMQRYGATIQAVASDPSIDAIVLKVDSPGGQVNGTDELVAIIERCSKPIVGYVDDSACSGAYRILAPCRAIVANNKLAVVGSLGVMASYMDYTKANELKGITEHKVYAPQSKHKNRQSRDMASGDFSSLEKDLEIVADQFLSAIKLARPNVATEHLTGDVFFAQDVVGTLVDSIGSLDSAISMALSFSKNKQKTITKMKTQNAVASALSVDALESLDGFVSLSEDQVEVLNTAIEGHVSALSVSTQATSDLAVQLSAAQDALSSMTAERDTLQARVVELESSPATGPSTTSAQSDGGVLAGTSQYSAEQEARKYL